MVVLFTRFGLKLKFELVDLGFIKHKRGLADGLEVEVGPVGHMPEVSQEIRDHRFRIVSFKADASEQARHALHSVKQCNKSHSCLLHSAGADPALNDPARKSSTL